MVVWWCFCGGVFVVVWWCFCGGVIELGSADLVFLCFVCLWREQTATAFALKRSSLGSDLDCVAPCLEESLLSLAKPRLEEVSLSTLNVWMFGSRTTVKKVRNSLTCFSHGSSRAFGESSFFYYKSV